MNRGGPSKQPAPAANKGVQQEQHQTQIKQLSHLEQMTQDIFQENLSKLILIQR